MMRTLRPRRSRSDPDSLNRDEAREAHWLARAELESGQSGFAEHVARRLSAGEHAYGARWAELGLARLLSELSEEAADLGAWGVLALQALELEHRLRKADAQRLAARLHAAIICGAHAHYALARARQELTRGSEAAGLTGGTA